MRARRLVYALLLCGAIGFYIFHSGYASFVLLLLVAGFLPLQLLVTLPIWLTTRLVLQPESLEVPCGQTAVLHCRAASRLPACTVRARLVCTNLLTGEKTTKKWKIRPGCAAEERMEYQSENSGAVHCALKWPAMVDIAGLFALPLKAPQPCLVLFYPPATTTPPQLPESATRQSELTGQDTSRPGPGGVREYTDMREYREGDSLRDVHWKLSAKLDKLIVREASFPAGAALHLAFDFFGEPETVNQRLARLAAFSAKLCDMERPHQIHWAGATGPEAYLVESRLDYDAFLWQLLATPLPAGGTSMRAAPPVGQGLLLVVGARQVLFYEEGQLKEVLE